MHPQTTPSQALSSAATGVNSSNFQVFWSALRARLMLCVVASIFAFHLSMQGQTAGAISHPISPLRDGQHDFDFNLSTWHTRITRIPDPLGASSASVTLDGTVTVRGIWGGRGQLEEIEADGPQGRWEGLTMFLYNPEAHQWNQTFLDSQTPTLSPAL